MYVCVGGWGDEGDTITLTVLYTTVYPTTVPSGVILDRVSFHGRFVHFHLPSFLSNYPPLPPPFFLPSQFNGRTDVLAVGGEAARRTDFI